MLIRWCDCLGVEVCCYWGWGCCVGDCDGLDSNRMMYVGVCDMGGICCEWCDVFKKVMIKGLVVLRRCWVVVDNKNYSDRMLGRCLGG